MGPRPHQVGRSTYSETALSNTMSAAGQGTMPPLTPSAIRSRRRTRDICGWT